MTPREASGSSMDHRQEPILDLIQFAAKEEGSLRRKVLEGSHQRLLGRTEAAVAA